MSEDKPSSPDHGALEEQFKAYAWGAWKRARRKVLAFAPALKGLSQHERRLLRHAALQDHEEITDELASDGVGETDPVSKVVHQTLGELLPTGEGDGPKLSRVDALRLMMAMGAARLPASSPPELLLIKALRLHELADQLEIERAREEGARTPRQPRAQKNAALISAAREIRRRRPSLSVSAIAKTLHERDEWRDLTINAIRKRLTGVL
ncbi:hypothetical protein [Microvirga arabica]|uniref:hypothetical protein n=1 Tax=Microvirga arabica TaxID=1128671 RepID=UPI0019396332|nr:hypothetical protein [Microvirga arabica]MBM1174293.1 hypothetical protein [Microvirga arabica]